MGAHVFALLIYALPDRINFTNSIILYKARKFGNKHMNYNRGMWNKTGDYDILNNISEYVTLVQLMGSLDNLNHTVNVF